MGLNSHALNVCTDRYSPGVNAVNPALLRSRVFHDENSLPSAVPCVFHDEDYLLDCCSLTVPWWKIFLLHLFLSLFHGGNYLQKRCSMLFQGG
jgi:hypothetical protein